MLKNTQRVVWTLSGDENHGTYVQKSAECVCELAASRKKLDI